MGQSAKDRILEHGIIAICRKIYRDDLRHAVEAMYEGGVRHLEVTFDQSDPACMDKTCEAIALAASICPEMAVGAGTVLTVEQVRGARQAGGSLIVSPNTDCAVIAETKKLGMVSIPGAMTPSEIVAAHAAGADIVKLFPASWLGTQYIRDITSPISHIPLLATGGVSLDNFGDFLDAGCCGAGLGGTLCVKSMIRDGQWDALQEQARKFVEIFRAHRKGAR